MFQTIRADVADWKSLKVNQDLDPESIEEISKSISSLPEKQRTIVTRDQKLWTSLSKLHSDIAMMKVNKGVSTVRDEPVWARKFITKHFAIFEDKIVEKEPGNNVENALGLVTMAIVRQDLNLEEITLDPTVAKTGFMELTWKEIERLGLEGAMITAIIKEIDCIIRNNCLEWETFDGEPPGEEVVDSRIVLGVKICTKSNRIKRAKARWVARGYGDPRSLGDTEATTVRDLSVRMLLFYAISRQWRCLCADYETAFLQSDSYERSDQKVLMKIPNLIRTGFGLKRNTHARLSKALYGLKDAPLQWQRKVQRVMGELGLRALESDPNVFIWVPDEPRGKVEKPSLESAERNLNTEDYPFRVPSAEVHAVIAVHVDDSLIAGTQRFFTDVYPEIEKKLRIGTVEETNFSFCGKSICYDLGAKKVSIGMNHYINALKPLDVPNGGDEEPYTTKISGKCPFRGAIGSLQWSTNARIDFGFDLSVLASSTAAPTIKDVKAVNKLIDKLHKRGNVELVIKALPLEDVEIITFTDASLNNRENGGTQQGTITTIAQTSRKNLENGFTEETIVGFPIFWKSSMLRRKCHSTPGAELLALKFGTTIGKWVLGYFLELGIGKHVIQLRTDARDVSAASATWKIPKERNLVADYAMIRQDTKRGAICVKHINKQGMLADVLTKENGEVNMLLDFLRTGMHTSTMRC